MFNRVELNRDPPATVDTSVRGIPSDSVLGAVSAQLLLKVFQVKYPWFARLARPVQAQDQATLNEFFQGIRTPPPDLFWRLRMQLANGGPFTDRLTQQEVLDWFEAGLSSRKVDVTQDYADLKTVQRAIESGDDYVITTEGRRFRSVVAICDFSKQVAKRVIMARTRH